MFEIDFGPLVEVLAEAERRVPGGVRDALEAEMLAAAETAKSTSAFVDRTGKLRAEISAEVTGSFEQGNLAGRVFAPTPYAIYVEEGTRPHRIEAHERAYLHWTSGGKHYFRKAVNHPGVRARFFLRDSVSLNRISEAVETKILAVLGGNQ